MGRFGIGGNMEEVTNATLHEILIRVEAKVDKTNGRVRSLELWRAGLAGSISIIGFVIVFILNKVF